MGRGQEAVTAGGIFAGQGQMADRVLAGVIAP